MLHTLRCWTSRLLNIRNIDDGIPGIRTAHQRLRWSWKSSWQHQQPSFPAFFAWNIAASNVATKEGNSRDEK